MHIDESIKLPLETPDVAAELSEAGVHPVHQGFDTLPQPLRSIRHRLTRRESTIVRHVCTTCASPIGLT